jgi:hypothetical protein
MHLSRQLVQLSFPEADVLYTAAASEAETSLWLVQSQHSGDSVILGRGATPEEAWADAAKSLNPTSSDTK